MAAKTATKIAPASNGATQHVEINGQAYPVVAPGADIHTMVRPVGKNTLSDGSEVAAPEVDDHVRVWLKAGYTLKTAQVIGTQVATTLVVNVLYVLVKYE